MNTSIKKIIMDIDSLPPKEAIETIKNFSENDIHIITQYDPNIYNNFYKDIKAIKYPLNYKCNKKTYFRISPDKIWGSLINDHQTLMLFDREALVPQRTNNIINEIVNLSISFQKYLEDINPDVVMFIATPHHIHTWTFARVAELLDIKVLYFMSNIFPWRYYLCQDLKPMPLLINSKKMSFSLEEKKLASLFMENKKGNYLNALPSYERNRLKDNKGKYLNLKRELTNWWHRPDLILNKILCFYQYKKLTVNFLMPEKYIVYFLHYQPERTTLPEGYGFAQQLLAIKILSMAIPENYSLIVKEHPSTFTSYCSWKERTPSYYLNIHKLANTLLAPIDQDAYTLIDNSMGVATITGTVSGEAIMRGKPVIVFGSGPMKNIDSSLFHQYTDLNNLALFIKHTTSSEFLNSVNEVNFEKIIKNTFCTVANDKINTIDIENIDYVSLRNMAVLNGIKSFFCDENY